MLAAAFVESVPAEECAGCRARFAVQLPLEHMSMWKQVIRDAGRTVRGGAGKNYWRQVSIRGHSPPRPHT